MAIEKLHKIYNNSDQPRNHKMKILVYCGQAGCGKSYKAKQYSDNYFMLSPPSGGNLWWDGYNNIKHDTIIIDEMCGAFMPLYDFKRLCDDNELMVNCKGYRLQFRAKTIIFTSNYHPLEWYTFKHDNDEFAFKRRIDDIQYFDQRYEILKQNTDNTPQHILDKILNKKSKFIEDAECKI
jgi:predicted Ser/Thr protein kinase